MAHEEDRAVLRLHRTEIQRAHAIIRTEAEAIVAILDKHDQATVRLFNKMGLVTHTEMHYHQVRNPE